MQRWTKGPVCGVGNCPSRHWRTVAGQRVCRFGHVREGEVEIGDDDDYVGRAVTSTQLTGRVSQVASSQALLGAEGESGADSGKPKELFGIERDVYRAKVFQRLLCNQIKWLINTKNAPRDLEQRAKYLWTIYIRDALASKGRERQFLFRLDSGICEGILGLACRILHAPIFMIDIMRWRGEGVLPGIDAIVRDPDVATRILIKGYQPTPNTVIFRTFELEKYFTSRKVVIPPPEMTVLLSKLCIDLFMPPEVLATALRMMQYSPPLKGYYSELVAAATVAGALYTLCDPIDGFPKLEMDTRRKRSTNRLNAEARGSARLIMDFELWSDLIRKVWLESSSNAAMTEYDVEFWSPEKTDRYLKWFATAMTIDPRNKAEKQMYDMFPIDEIENEPTTDVTVSSETVGELGKEMQKTLTWAGEDLRVLYPMSRKKEENQATFVLLLKVLGRILDMDVDNVCSATAMRVSRIFRLFGKHYW